MGNDERAKAFSERTGIAVYKWDVADFDACQTGVDEGRGRSRPGRRHRQQCRHHPRRHDEARWRATAGTTCSIPISAAASTCARRRGTACWSRSFGRVVNIGSINGQAGQYGQVNYAAAKSGIHGFTKALAQEGAPKGITVNAIAPGYIDTDMVAAVPADVLEKIVAHPGRPPGQGGARSRAACSSSSPTTPASSPARPCRSTAGSICIEAAFRNAMTSSPGLSGRPMRYQLRHLMPWVARISGR